jgi:hypothetical protein
MSRFLLKRMIQLSQGKIFCNNQSNHRSRLCPYNNNSYSFYFYFNFMS